MADGSRTIDPPFTGRFVFEVNGVEIGAFTEVTGLGVSLEVEDLNEGGNNVASIKLPGRLKWTNLVLKRGITDNDALFTWINKCSGEGLSGNGNKVEKLSGSVALLDGRHKQLRRWQFREAMPVRWAGPQVSATSSALATEELEVSHGGFTVG
jgi:phage tail-like protein